VSMEADDEELRRLSKEISQLVSILILLGLDLMASPNAF
jgi:hypothetical protein